MHTTVREFYRLFFQEAEIGMWMGELRRPVPVTLSESQQYLAISQGGYLAHCNRTFAVTYGYTNPAKLIGTALGRLFFRPRVVEEDLLREFIRGGWQTHGVHSTEVDHDGHSAYYEHSCFGVVERNKLVRIWGMRRAIEGQRVKEFEQKKLLRALSVNQQRILEMTVQGRTLKEIGAALSVSINTVESYRIRALRRLGIQTVPELIRLAAPLGLEGRRDDEGGRSSMIRNLLAR